MKKNIVLKQLTLTNYRNIEFAIYQFNGNSMIVGENRIGKTNTLEAIYWLLTDYLLGNSADTSKIKPLSDTRKEVSVEGVFDVDGVEQTIKKVFKEDWVKTRGTSEEVFKGHSTIYYINGLKQTKKGLFVKEVASIFGLNDCKIETAIDANRLLVDPFYLGEMGEAKDWTNLRSLIIELVGDVSDKDVIASDEKFAPLEDLLKRANGKIEIAKKGADQQVKDLKNQISIIEGAIKGFAEVAKPSEENVSLARKAIEDCDIKIAALRSNSGIDEQSHLIEAELNDVNSQINVNREKSLELKSSNPELEKINKSIEESQQLHEESMNKLNNAKRESYPLSNNVNFFKAEIEKEKRTQSDLIEKIKAIDNNKKNARANVPTECPTCHRPYEAEDIQTAVDNIITKLDNDRNELIKKGKESKQRSLNVENDLHESQIKLDKIKETIKELECDVAACEEHIDEWKEKRDSLSNTPSTNIYDEKVKELEIKRDEIKARLDQSRIDFSKGCQDINSQILEEQEKKKPFESIISDFEYFKRCQEQAENKRAERNSLATKLADAEQNVDLFSKFIKKKLEMLDSNVAKVFGNIKFQLIHENINGGYDTVCKAYIYDVNTNQSTNVSWSSGSKSEKVITGIAIAEKIKEALNLPNLPYLFDEGGEISTDTFNTRFKTDSQLICVKVKDGITTPVVVNA